MSNVLDQIVAQKWLEIAQAEAITPVGALMEQAAHAPPVRDFYQSLLTHHPMGLIAEVKRASPSAGLIRADFDPAAIASAYAENGAACISVLTDEKFFQGSLDYLRTVRETVSIPVLRKDFILAPYQVYEARSAGADAILLIAECLDDQQLHSLYELALELGMQALVEVYEPENVSRVLKLQPAFMGVNNRNLRTFETDLQHTVRLRQQIPTDILLIGESGIHTRQDVLLLQEAGVHGILVGESLIRSADIGQRVRELLGH